MDWISVYIPSFIVGVITSVLGSILVITLVRSRKSRPLSRFLNFNGDKLIFIFPHRKPDFTSILPHTSTEDFLAVNNFISALLKAGIEMRIIAKDDGHIKESDRNEDLVAICSPKSNSFSREVQEVLLDNGYDMYYFKQLPDSDRWVIADGDIGQYQSRSYDAMAKLLEKKVPKNEIPQHIFEDVAILSKVVNPWNSVSKIFIVAGIRGIGTWGAAECIKKKWQDIYNHPALRDKTGEFSALLKITYSDYDIVNIEIHNVKQPLRITG
ncbi:MAG: hypothetical protein GY856_49570 [bacterium]|nr:hypothetical protein [bacterium]